jgi:O-acetyl-ADP-ribose deacetylase (regulator of RNase III)
MTGSIRLMLGDITTIAADAIVNAANAALVGGGGVDGAIHRAGGPSIMRACRAIGRCPTGTAVVTGAGALAARYVIHAVAPRYHGSPRDAELLRSAYDAALRLAAEHGCASVAFPSLGTGAYAYPIAEAAPIALAAVRDHLAAPTSVREVVFVLFSETDLAAYRAANARWTDVAPEESSP